MSNSRVVLQRFLGLFVLCLILPMIPANAQDLSLKEIQAIEKNILDKRLSIKSFEMNIAITLNSDRHDNDKNFFSYLVDGDKKIIRNKGEGRKYKNKKSSPPAYDNINAANCVVNDYLLRGFIINSVTGIPEVHFSSKSEREGYMLNGSMDPIKIGITSSIRMLNYEFNIDSMIGNPKRTELVGKYDILDGIKMIKISFKDSQHPSNYSIKEYWVNPNQDNQIVKIAVNFFESDDNHKSYEQIVKLTLKKDEKSGLWFPSKMKHVENDLDNKKKSEQDFDIEVISLNQPINPSRFASLKAMGFPPGTRVYGYPNPEGRFDQIYDGNEIRDMKYTDNLSPKAEEAIPVNPPPAKRSYPWIIVTISLAVIMLLQHLIRKRKNKIKQNGS